MKESLRLSPPVPVSVEYRPTQSGCTIRGVQIPQNTALFLNFGAVQRDPTQWQRPLEYLPERFDPESGLFARPDGGLRHPLSFVPFSFGTRGCPGQAFGLLEAKVCVAYVAMKFKFDLDLEPELQGVSDISFSIGNPFKVCVKLTSSI